ncbi:MAG TPA: SIS domain-containing protein [Nocardioidaceae bacterium]|nr:SIS domain-containing protein [Nocardioidaceae bacterium]
MTLLEQEIREQPQVAQRLLDRLLPGIDELAAVFRSDDVVGVHVVGRGSSDNVARYAQYVWGLRLGLPVTLAAPSISSVYGRGLDLRSQAVVAISQSGSSPDVVGVVEQARAQGRPTLAITNDPESALAAAAERVLDLGVGPERSVAATKTYTSSLLAVALITAALGGRLSEDARDLAQVPDALETALDAVDVTEAVELLRPHHRAVCVGRGYNLASAHETGLKLTELTGTLVATYSPADLLHGPIAAVSAEVPAVLVAPEEPARASVLEIVPELERRGAPILVAGSAGAAAAFGSRGLTFPPEAQLADWLSPLTAIVPGQLLAWRLAESRGIEVDRPGELRKVTRTR